MKGFPLEEINEALGTTEADAQRILSILKPDVSERDLLSRIFEDKLEDEGDCYLSLNWNQCLVDGKQKIFWKDVFDLDKAGRALTVRKEEKLPAAVEDVLGGNEDVLVMFQENIMKMMNDGFEKINKRLDALEGRVMLMEKRIGSEDEGDKTEYNDGDGKGKGDEVDGGFGDNAGSKDDDKGDEGDEALGGDGDSDGSKDDDKGDEGDEGLGGDGDNNGAATEGYGDEEGDHPSSSKIASPTKRPTVRRRKARPSKFHKSLYV